MVFEREYRSRLRVYLQDRLRELEGSVMNADAATAFASDYRTRMKTYLESQLRELDDPAPGVPSAPPVTGPARAQVDPAVRDPAS